LAVTAARKTSLALFDNTQFIYELALARMELKAFGVEFAVEPDMRTFEATSIPDPEVLVRRLAYFGKVGDLRTDYDVLREYNTTRSANQYMTHWIYPYKGKFHPQLVRALLNIMQIRARQIVLDPFIGSGTTALECMLLGINCVGVDISPLCVLISRVKTLAVQGLDEIHAQASAVQVSERSTPTLFGEPSPRPGLSGQADEFFRAAEMIAASDRARRGKEFGRSFRANLQRMMTSTGHLREARDRLGLTFGEVDVQLGDARRLPLAAESVDGIITSPPYSIALDYVQNDAHALSALGCDLGEIRDRFIGVRGHGESKFRLYEADMKQSVQEMGRVLKPGGYCAIVVGNVTFRGEEVPTTDHIIRFAEEAGLRLQHRMDKIIFGLYNVMQREFVLLFQKRPSGAPAEGETSWTKQSDISSNS
jgi:SAM-dependent methyltransferase